MQAQSAEEPITAPASSTSYQQTISLEEGWNLVSLRVAPDMPAIEELLGPHVDEIVLAKNLTGATYMAREEMDQLGSWAPHEAYFVYVESAMEWTVNGAVWVPESTPLALVPGWNLIPYLPKEPLSVEEALTSVLPNVLIVDDAQGHVYVPETGIATLDSLHAGQGYKLYITAADTLRYAPDPAEPLVTNTLAEALALEGLTPGQQVEVRGYHTPGDGGGGLFEVTDDACATDGGTCFAFDEDVSAAWTHTTSNNLLSPYSLTPHQLVWGSITVQYGTTPEETIPHELMHGHGTATRNLDWIDYGGGTIGASGENNGGARFFHVRQAAGYGTSDPFVIRYKSVESPRRLKRMGVTDSMDIRWWGAKPADSANPYNARNDIAYAINAAAKLYDAGGINWAHVDIPGEYYYRYTIRVRNGVNVRGAGDAVYGNAADGNPTRGKLTIAPGVQMDHRLGLLSEQEWNMLQGMRMTEIDLTHAYMVEKVGMEDLEVYGNVAGNQQVIDNVSQDLKTQLQNANSWNGFASKGVNSWATPDNATAHFLRVYFHDFPGNGLGMNNALDFTPSRYVRVGDAQKNHHLYRTRGHHRDWQIDGAGWAALIKVTDATFENLMMSLGPNNFADLPGWGETWVTPFDHHGANFGANPVDNADLIARNNIEVDNFTIDISAGNDRTVEIFAGVGYKGHYSNGTILTPPNKSTVLFHPAGGSNLPVNSYTIENINVIDQGGGVNVMAYGAPHSHNVLKNITVEGFANSRGGDFIGIPMIAASNPWAQPYDPQDPLAGNFVYPQGTSGRLDIINLNFKQERTHWIFRPLNYPSGEVLPYDIFVSGTSIDNADQAESLGILRSASGSRAVRLYLYDSTINVYEAHHDNGDAQTHWHITHPEQTLRVRDVVDRVGRSSDRTGTFTSTSSDEGQNYVLIETNLLSYANETEAIITSGPSDISVGSIEIANANGSIRDQLMPEGGRYEHRDPYLRVNLNRALAAGETVTLDWAARCTPLDMFSPTGVFKARAVDPVTISGGAPVTIDLLGTMASMESSDVIAYSATSGDEAIVAVSMGEHDRFLMLTPLGSGTTTVTVTGGIAGIGTATEEVEVVVE